MQEISMIKHLCGILWIVTYLLAIRRGYLDKSYGIPALAIILNIAWEIYDAFYTDHSIMRGYGIIWLILDLCILYQMIQMIVFHSARRSNTFLKYLTVSALGIALYFVVLVCDTHYQIRFFVSAFFQNALMSLLFIHMILSRKNLSGQSLYIALCKMAATGIVILAIVVNVDMNMTRNLRFFPFYLTILGADIVYLVLYIHYARRDSVDIWSRI